LHIVPNIYLPPVSGSGFAQNERRLAIESSSKTVFVPLILLFLFPLTAFAGPAVTLDANTTRIDLSPFLDYVKETGNRLTIHQITSRAFSSRFRPIGTVNHSFVDSAYWLRFSLQNQTGKNLHPLLEIGFPFLDHIELYEPVDRDNFKKCLTGRALPFDSRQIKHRNFLFRLEVKPGISTYYVRIKTESAMYFPMTLWQERFFWKKDHDCQFALGFYYGIIAVMALYNLFIYFSLRDRAYLFYVIYISCFAIYQMTANGLAYEYLWPEAAWWNRHATIFFAGTAQFWAVLFTKDFLGTQKTAPLLDKILNWIAGASLALVFFSLFISYGIMLKITLLLVAIFVTFMLLTGFVCWRMGQHSARFYLLAWVALLGGIMILILWNVGWLPSSFFTINAIQFGSVLDVVLLSLALADRINELRSAREQALESAMAERLRAEKQREAMVRELHDGIGGIATNISILAEKARLHIKSQEIDEDLKAISTLARQGRKEIGSFMDCLDEGEQPLGAFIAELRYLGNQILQPNHIEFILRWEIYDEKITLGPFVRLNLQKIFGEALTNVVKHANASKVEAAVRVTKDGLCLEIRDNGKGFSTLQTSKLLGRGISNMKKRARSLGGTLKINGADGIYIELEIPLSGQTSKKRYEHKCAF